MLFPPIPEGVILAEEAVEVASKPFLEAAYLGIPARVRFPEDGYVLFGGRCRLMLIRVHSNFGPTPPFGVYRRFLGSINAYRVCLTDLPDVYLCSTFPYVCFTYHPELNSRRNCASI